MCFYKAVIDGAQSDDEDKQSNSVDLSLSDDSISQIVGSSKNINEHNLSENLIRSKVYFHLNR